MMPNLGLSSDLYLCLNVHTFHERQQAFITSAIVTRKEKAGEKSVNKAFGICKN